MDKDKANEKATVVTPQIVQGHIKAGMDALSKTTSSYSAMAKQHGPNPLQWPVTSQWYIAFHNFQLAENKAGICTYSDLGVSAYGK